ncbi:glutathione S-transferase family protein [Abyssibacter profundi]|uniref:Glutathione S-transferase n=1 Tax=Abyssibacter profundi TaxID=2182787 RepID=A0A363UKK4_9GAMM|nr:glutathione S-transferase family protein [Abyssibacter profundi]PWN55951.1 glutathione S-transferase [Abyssibacter profundi]
MIVYGDARSGNCYKIALLASHLSLPLEWREIDVLSGQTRQPWFLRMNPFGKLPVVQLDDGTYLAESNAVLIHLAQHSTWWPTAPLDQARVLQWLFWEQYSHEPYIATSRFWLTISGRPEAFRAQLADRHPGGNAALDVLDAHLATHPWLVGRSPTVADIALYAYTHVAHEGGFDLAPRPALRAWLQRMQDTPGHAAMRSPGPHWSPPQGPMA